MKKIAIDAMGGEHAPQAIVEAVLSLVKQLPQTKFILFGDKNKIENCLIGVKCERIEIVNTTEVIDDSDEPVKAIKQKGDSSMVVAAKYVKDGQADALFSMGNTGALLACGIFIIGRIKGVKRPALMPTLPSSSNKLGFNMIDVGANAQSKPEYLIQWAKMAELYAEKIRKIAHPRIALLNNGAEFDKGDVLHQEVYKKLLKEDLNFVGNIEGNELFSDKADIVVTDGFCGNIALKTLEGTSQVIVHEMKQSLLNNGIIVKLGALLAKHGLQSLKSHFDVARYGGAVLIGLNAPVVKTHGRSDKRSVYYTLLQIDKMLDEHLIDEFKKYFLNNN